MIPSSIELKKCISSLNYQNDNTLPTDTLFDRKSIPITSTNLSTLSPSSLLPIYSKELERLYDAFSNDLSLFNILLLITNSFFSNQCPSPFLHTIQSLLKYDGICIYQVKDNIIYNCIVWFDILFLLLGFNWYNHSFRYNSSFWNTIFLSNWVKENDLSDL